MDGMEGNIKISYAITVCNEFVEIQRLVNFLLKNIVRLIKLTLNWLQET